MIKALQSLAYVALLALATALAVMLGGCTSTPSELTHQDLTLQAALAYELSEHDAVINDKLVEPMTDYEVFQVIKAIENFSRMLHNWKEPPQTEPAWREFERQYLQLRQDYLGVYLLAMQYWELYDDKTRDKLRTVHQRYVVIDATTQGLLIAKGRKDAYESAIKVGEVMLSILSKG